MQKLKLKFKSFFSIFYFLLVFLTLDFLLLTYGQIYAVDMESSRFRINEAHINSAAGNKDSSNYKLSDTIGQLAAGQFSSTGYIVKAGFQYFHSIIPFRFSISNINISLGNLMPNTPSTSTTNLAIDFGSTGQYQVTAIEQTTLKTLTGNYIPDTNCDGGDNTCSESLAKIWSSSNAYGFGYNMTGDDIPTDFISLSYFRPFPNLSNDESPSVVMSSLNIGKNRQATMTFKANISPIQPAGSYQTVINFVATPSF